MGLLTKLKSLLGMEDGEVDRHTAVDVTVERESGRETPAAAAERAVKEPIEETASPGAATEPESDVGAGAEPEADAEAESESGAEAEPVSEEAAESVDVIKGIGPSYQDRLADAGVETVGDLSTADADDLADDTGISAKRLGRWIDRAKARLR